jgi:hypothetical protein
MNNVTSINSIVGRRPRTPTPWVEHIDGWAPGYGPVCHRRSVGRAAIPGFVLIGLGVALFLAAWAHRRNNHD